MDTTQQAIGVLGGTFDPVHNGHLFLAEEILNQLHLKNILFVPNFQPLLRNAPIATPAQRLAMLKIALAQNPRFMIDDFELHQQGPSYTINTLRYLRTTYPLAPICLIMAMDQFQQLDRWHQWEKLLEFAHIIVGKRKSYETISPTSNPIIYELLHKYQTLHWQDLHEKKHGLIYLFDIDTLPISSTEIRAYIKGNKNLGELVPNEVADYININKLYR